MAKHRLRQNKSRQHISLLPLKWIVLIHVINLSASQTHNFSLISPSVSNQIIFLLSFQKSRFYLSTALIKPCPITFLGQILHITTHPDFLIAFHPTAILNQWFFGICHKTRQQENGDFQVSEDRSSLFPSPCLLPHSLQSAGSLPHVHLAHLFFRLDSPGLFYSFTDRPGDKHHLFSYNWGQ